MLLKSSPVSRKYESEEKFTQYAKPAGASGLGVYQAAKDLGKLAIGVDSNQNGIHPGTMLTSMVKHVDKVVYDGFSTARDGTWKPGLQSLGLKEGGVDWALDDNNRALVSDAMEQRVRAATAEIIARRITVPDGT